MRRRKDEEEEEEEEEEGRRRRKFRLAVEGRDPREAQEVSLHFPSRDRSASWFRV